LSRRAGAACAAPRHLCVFVNGLFSPKGAPGEEDAADEWASTKASLESVWEGCEALHVHNPTMAVDAEKLLGKAVQGGSAKMALGASLFALTLVAVDTYLETGHTGRVVGATMDKARSTLDDRAHEVSRKIEAELLRLVAPRGVSEEAGKDEPVKRLSSAMTSMKVEEGQIERPSTGAAAGKADHFPPRGAARLELVAHSHGGWCVRALIDSGGLARVLNAAPHLRVRLWILGCPVLVKFPSSDVKLASRVSVLQLHNELDVVSLRYEPDSAKKQAAHVVRTSDRGVWHSLKSYLIWLPEVISKNSVDP
jgi:hypothetical protein